MTEIKVDTHLLQTKAEMVRRYRQQHMETMGRLKKLIFSLNETWKGEAQDAFIASYQSMQPSFKEFNAVLYNYYNLMKKVASEMEKTDNEMKRLIQRIDS